MQGLSAPQTQAVTEPAGIDPAAWTPAPGTGLSDKKRR